MATDSQHYTVQVPLRWSDMDAYGHVNNVQFLRLLEDARVVGIREWFVGRPSMLDEGIVVSRHAIEYRAPLTYRPAPVEVEMWVTHVHGAGFDLGYVVRDPADAGEQVYAVAETGLVYYDFASARPRRLTPDDRAALAAHTGDPVRFRWAGR
ncbi:acyl-CoA thioesterase [Oryzobacter sp. R7]|uniref:acyl-CoA thioesterase n=1 Tax=Oryzobacter faecalis TaxID=3388656 RepID=UPI00398CBABC